MFQDWGTIGDVTPFQLLSTFMAAGYVPAEVPGPVWDTLAKVMPAMEAVLGIKPFYPEYTAA